MNSTVPETCPLRALLATRRTEGDAPCFDMGCACGHLSSECTKRSDGTCDG